MKLANKTAQSASKNPLAQPPSAVVPAAVWAQYRLHVLADDGGIWLYRDSEVMTGSGFNARKIERMRQRASTYVDGTLGRWDWDQDAFGGDFERYVQDQAEAFKGSIARHPLF